MSKFQVGDKVRRVGLVDQAYNDPTAPEFVEKDGVYTVSAVNQYGHLELVGKPVGYTYVADSFVVEYSLEDVLRDRYPGIYDDLVRTGKFGLAPREDVYEVTIRVAQDNHETEETIEDYLKDYVEEVPGQFLVRVQKVSD